MNYFNRRVGLLLGGLLFLTFALPLCAEPRSFEEIFPNLTQNQKKTALSSDGLKRSFRKNSHPALTPAPNLGIDLAGTVMEKQPSHIIEALVVVPYNGKELDRLDAYNAIGRIKNIKNHFYFNAAENKNIVIFKDTTRLESAQKRNPVPDPPPALRLPSSETVYLRFDDANFGNLYIQGDVSISPYGITYNMTNFVPVRFLVFTIMKAEKFSAVVYIEPVIEGILVYGMSGIDLPGFIAGRLNVSSDIEKRLTVLVNWLTDGLRM